MIRAVQSHRPGPPSANRNPGTRVTVAMRSSFRTSCASFPLDGPHLLIIEAVSLQDIGRLGLDGNQDFLEFLDLTALGQAERAVVGGRARLSVRPTASAASSPACRDSDTRRRTS